MKKHLLFLSALLLSVTALFAQAPQKMSYQAVVRNTNNTLVTNQSVSAKISILQGGVNGTPVYVETHFVTTNANGLLTLEVGNGTAVSGSMATVNWANGPFFLKSEIDPDGGINYSIEGTQQLLSVPYALYAEKAGNVPAFGIVPVDSGYVISVVQPGGTPQTYFLPTGGQGPAGPAGNDGLSAYQLWLNAGNTGSEADFLASLVGTPGNDGNDGQDGVGIDSVAKTGSVANVDTYTIYYSNHTTSTYTVTNGVDGTPGDPGSPGDPGTPGFSPTITVDTGAAGMVLTITDVNGTNQYLIPSGGGSSSGGTIVQQQVNWNETNPASVTYILNKPSLATVATSGNYNDLLNKPTIPTNISQLNNDAGYLTGQDVTNLNNNVSNLSNSVNNLQSSIDTMQNNISNLQQTVANIPAPVQSNWNETNTASPAYIQNKPTIPTVPTNVSAFQNDAGYITNAAVPTFNVTQTDTGYVLTMTPPGGNAQQYVLRNGVDGENGAAGNGISYVTGPVTSGNVDTYTIHYTNGTTSNFTVTNGTNGQNGLSPTINVTTGDAGTVLTITDATGTHQHTIPNSSSSGGTIVQQQVNWNETNPSSVSYILNKPNLATVATSGNYNDLTNKPTIPTVPSNLSAFQNDAGFISSQNIQQYLPEVPAQVNADWNATSGVAQILHKPTLATVATSGSYNDLSNKPTIPAAQVNTDWNATSGIAQILNKPTLAPVATSGSYNDLSNKPTIPAAQVNADWNATSGVAQILHKPALATVATSGSYNDLTNKPTIPTVPSNVSAFQNDAGYISSQNIQQYLPEVPAQVNADWNATSGVAQILHKPTLATVATTGSYNDLTNKPTIPTQVKSDWNVLDTSSAAYIKNKPIIPAAQVNADWNATSGVALILHKPTLATVATSGSYNDLTNKPTIPAEQVQANWNETNTSSKAYIKNKPTIPAAQVNADWNATSGVAQILHKPTLATVATTGNYNDLSNKPTIPTQVKSDWTEYDTSSVAYIKNKPTILSYNDIQNMINNSVGALNNRIDSLQNELNNAQTGNNTGGNNDATFVCGTSKLYDIDGNAYNTVKIGNYCWMKENLRTTHYADGTALIHGFGNNNCYQEPQTISLGIDKAGLLYNMMGAMNGTLTENDLYGNEATTGAGASNRQGVCPDGWHIPNLYNEFYDLEQTIADNQWDCYISREVYGKAKAMASDLPNSWPSSTNQCAIGNDLTSNNLSGFSAVGTSYGHVTTQNNTMSFANYSTSAQATFWTLTAYWGYMQNLRTDSLICYSLTYDSPLPVHYTNPELVVFDNNYFLSVRCVRNEAEGAISQMQQTIEDLQNQIDQMQIQMANQDLNNASMQNQINQMQQTIDSLQSQNEQMQQQIQQMQQQQGSAPTVSVSLVSMDYNKAKVKVTVNGQGEALLTKGACWISGTSTPSLNNSYLTSDTSANTFYITIPSLSVTGTYTVRGFATNIHGTGYSSSLTIRMVQTVPTTGSRTISLSTDSVWVYDAGGPDGNYDNNWDGYLVIKPYNSYKRVKLASGTYAFEGSSSYDYLDVYNGTNTTATSGYAARYYLTSGSVSAYVSSSSDGALTIRFRSDGSRTFSGFALKFVLVDAPCGRTDTTSVSDYQGNTYTIKAFGSQCWMTQNLRSRYYSDGSSISAGPETTAVNNNTPYYYYPNGVNSTANINNYGLLYNWKAVMRNSSSSTSNPSGVQGICPSGWHVPSNAELVQFMNFIQSHSEYACGSSSFAKALASTYGWTTETSSCWMGNNQTSNNASGFNLPPAGYLYNGATNDYRYYGSQAFMWTSTQGPNNQSVAYSLRLYGNTVYYSESSTTAYESYTRPCSVRCVKNN
ncbi:MAG: hypothetical protein II865_00620 [Bacteroidales bacterium]|nr:hypothetical protein [Bacteroidales bacterium]